MTTNELEGRALAEAAARAMGWTCDGADGVWRDAGGTHRGSYYECGPELTERECLAWLHTKGKVHTSSESDWCYTRLLFRPSLTESVCAGDATFLEALQRLVVAVAAREVKQ